MEEGDGIQESSYLNSLAAGANGQSTLAADMTINGNRVMIEDSVEGSPLVETVNSQRDLSTVDFDAEVSGIYDSNEQATYVEAPLDLNLPDGHFPDSTTRDIMLSENEELERLHNGTQTVRTGYVYSAAMMLHEHPANELDYEREGQLDEDGLPYRPISPHPEQPDRIKYIFVALRGKGCLDRMRKIPIREIKKEETMLVHDEAMWEGLQRSMAFTSDTLRLQSKILDTASSLYVNQHSARCARLSCGGVVEMCDAVASGRIRNGFAIVRPPGHHAEPDGAMGFCFYNNVAVAARWLQQKYGSVNDQTRCKKIMILDWDVHHGNGTQSAFWNDPDILYVSIHRFEPGFYPPGQAGNADQVGGGPGVGRNVNIPWPCAMMGDADYVAAFRQIVMPIATEFDPDLVIISAGFDAARGDHLGECDVTPNGYGQMTYDLARLANGRLVVALEGCYNLDSITNSAVEVTEVLLGEAPKALEEPTRVCSTTASETLRMVEHIQSEHWACMRREPRAPIDDGIQEEVDGVSDAIVSLSSLHSAYRMQRVATKYDLTEFPLGSEVLGAHCLSSSTILDSDTRNVILFVHDMGNLRLELPWLHKWDVKQELGYIVDASAQVRSWASEKNVKLIDINLDTESELQSGNANDWHGQRLADTGGAESRRLARLALLHVWDDTINILHLTSNAEGWPLKVVLIGLGAGCDAITNLIEKRRVKECVKAVIQVPYHASVPELPKDSMKRKWYFSHSQVYLPLNHRIYHSEDDILATAKRFGKVIRSSEARAARVLRHEFEPIAAFIEESLSK